MNRIVTVLAAVVGGSILAYTASFYAGTDRIAFALTMVLSVAFAAGLAELHRFASKIERLHAELDAALRREGDDALDGCGGELRDLLGSRLEGSPRSVPQPVFTPFLVGLLVMLGLLGTFLGLFETLRGAHAALAESQDMEALRAGLSSPMRGLMRSFGTSAAGVSTSAVLGLAAVLVRKRAQTFAGALSEAVSGALSRFASAKRQLASLEALSAQGHALPEAASALSAAAGRLGALEGVIESALRGVADTFSQRAERTMSETIASASALLRESAEAAHASSGSDRARLEEWSRRFDESSRQLAAAVSAQADALTKLESGARERMTETVEGADRQLRALMEHLDARLARAESSFAARVGEVIEAIDGKLAKESEAVGEHSRRIVEAVAERIGALIERVDAAEDGQRARVEATEARSAALLVEVEKAGAAHAERLGAIVARLDVADASQRERMESVLTGLSEVNARQRGHVESLLTRLDAADASQRDRVESVLTRLDAADASQRDRVESLLSRLSGADEAHAARVESLEKSLATLLEDQAHTLGVDLKKQAMEFAQGIGAARQGIVEASTTLAVAGAELASLAESFGVSVEQHREGAKAWLESLGELEAAIVRAGEGAAAEALESHLAHTQELFDRQLRFQRELFAQLRALRGDETGESSEQETSDAAQ
jgi:hypothetical protein